MASNNSSVRSVSVPTPRHQPAGSEQLTAAASGSPGARAESFTLSELHRADEAHHLPQSQFAQSLKLLRDAGTSVGGNEIVHWTHPFELARMSHLHGKQAWPDDLFVFFANRLRDESIIDCPGSHSFLDVLYQHREKLSPKQRNTLKTVLKEAVFASLPLRAGRVRLQQFLNHDGDDSRVADAARLAQMQKAIRRQVGVDEAAQGLFKTFRIVELGESRTRCVVSTDDSAEWSFDVDVSTKRMAALLGDRHAHLMSSRVAELISADEISYEMARIQHHADMYDTTRRAETCLGLPDALAKTQRKNCWSDAVFNLLLGRRPDSPSAIDLMEMNRIAPKEQIRSVLAALSRRSIHESLTDIQWNRVKEWVERAIDLDMDDELQSQVVRFIIDGHKSKAVARPELDPNGYKAEARGYFTFILTHHHPDAEGLNDQQRRREQKLVDFAKAGLLELEQPEQKTEPSRRASLSRLLPRLSRSPSIGTSGERRSGGFVSPSGASPARAVSQSPTADSDLRPRFNAHLAPPAELQRSQSAGSGRTRSTTAFHFGALSPLDRGEDDK
jgi:hypothetical protein